MDENYIKSKMKMIFWIFELCGWFQLVASIPFWFITKMPLSSIVMAIMGLIWVIGVRIDRKRIIKKFEV